MVNIEINGIPVQAREGAMLIEAADEAGINIPRFCYHKKLSVAANCRMCLVDVEKAPKAMPACATPVSEGMVVFTRSSKALRAQKSVMEFLLINHPLDCPICDQGGECQLQEVAMGYGQDVSRFAEKKRVIKDKNIGPLVATDMTRCIHCTRCVRFGKEIAGIREMGATGRGEHMEIGTYIEKSVDSEMSGNIIDLCPVGALTSKPYRYKARPWELQDSPSISAHDCVGSNITIQTRRNELMRVLPQENESINEVWLSDRDRFSYEGVNSKHRLQVPMIKVDGKWEETDWNAALDFVVARLRHTLQGGANKLAALVSPSATVEEMYLTQKLMRGLGSNNIDHRLGQVDFREQDKAPLFPYLGGSIESLEQLNAVLIVGGNIRKAQPILNHRLRKAAMKGGKVMFINAMDYDYNYNVAEKRIVAPNQIVLELAAVAKALLTINNEAAPSGFANWVENITVHDAHLAMAEHLRTAERALILIGDQAPSLYDYSAIQGLAQLVSRLSGAKLGQVSVGANAAGAWLSGCIPHRGAAGEKLNAAGEDCLESMSGQGKGFLLLGVEPELDAYNAALAQNAMKNSDCVIALTAYNSDSLRSYADVLLPIATFAETSGTFINVEGQWQGFKGALAPVGEARPAWKILRVMGNMFDLQGFDYMSSEEVRDELFERLDEASLEASSEYQITTEMPQTQAGVVCRIGELAPYAVDAVVRRAKALQNTEDGRVNGVMINDHMASHLGLSEGDQVYAEQQGHGGRTTVRIDNRVPDQCAWIASGLNSSANLGGRYDPLTLKKA